eukprot:764055-Hanusia_phi.AAC.2
MRRRGEGGRQRRRRGKWGVMISQILLDETYKKLVEDFCEKDAKHIILNRQLCRRSQSCLSQSFTDHLTAEQIVSSLLSPAESLLECEKKTQKRQHLMEEIRRCNWQASDVHKDILPASIMLKFGIKPGEADGSVKDVLCKCKSVLFKQVLSDDSEDISSNLIAEAETVPPSLQGISRLASPNRFHGNESTTENLLKS